MSQARFDKSQADMGGWVRVYLCRGEPTGEVAKFLSHAPTHRMRQHPHMRVRMIVPITNNGDTSELHAWYDRVLFPAISAMAEPESSGAMHGRLRSDNCKALKLDNVNLARQNLNCRH